MDEMKFEIHSKPLAKKRHRTAYGKTYNPQIREATAHKFVLAHQMRENGFKQIVGPLKAELLIDVEVPKSWSKKKKLEMIGRPVTTKPDNDNYEKFYFDVLNGIGFYDDSQISLNLTQKIYADKPRVIIELTSMEGPMITEHAITYKDKLSAEELNYIVKKANRLGQMKRAITRVFQQEDSEGTHIYFEAEGLKEK
jgi:Holliday junction resolvase RusA-like endonuclease